jgi:hypothetical protein
MLRPPVPLIGAVMSRLLGTSSELHAHAHARSTKSMALIRRSDGSRRVDLRLDDVAHPLTRDIAPV